MEFHRDFKLKYEEQNRYNESLNKSKKLKFDLSWAGAVRDSLVDIPIMTGVGLVVFGLNRMGLSSADPIATMIFSKVGLTALRGLAAIPKSFKLRK